MQGAFFESIKYLRLTLTLLFFLQKIKQLFFLLKNLPNSVDFLFKQFEVHF